MQMNKHQFIDLVKFFKTKNWNSTIIDRLQLFRFNLRRI